MSLAPHAQNVHHTVCFFPYINLVSVMCNVGSWLGIAELPPDTDYFQALITAQCLTGTTHAQIFRGHSKKKKNVLKSVLSNFWHESFHAIKLRYTRANSCQIIWYQIIWQKIWACMGRLRKGHITILLEIVYLIHINSTTSKSLPKCQVFEANEWLIILKFSSCELMGLRRAWEIGQGSRH